MPFHYASGLDFLFFLVSMVPWASPVLPCCVGIHGHVHPLKAVAVLLAFPSLYTVEPCSKDLNKYFWKKSLFWLQQILIATWIQGSEAQKPVSTKEVQFIGPMHLKVTNISLAKHGFLFNP